MVRLRPILGSSETLFHTKSREHENEVPALDFFGFRDS